MKTLDPVTETDHPLPDFSSKTRVFEFKPGVDRTDVGRCTGYWLLKDGRRCVSEISLDRAGHIFETYFFSKIGLEHLTEQQLFEQVKAAHLNYDHDPALTYCVSEVEDNCGEIFWVVEICIAEKTKLLRHRKPFFKFYARPDLPQSLRWPAMRGYFEAQQTQTPFLLLEGETGSPSWGDSNFHKLTQIESLALLETRLREKPVREPVEDYRKFNLGIIDARNPDQPFNETVYHLAENWPLSEA